MELSNHNKKADIEVKNTARYIGTAIPRTREKVLAAVEQN